MTTWQIRASILNKKQKHKNKQDRERERTYGKECVDEIYHSITISNVQTNKQICRRRTK